MAKIQGQKAARRRAANCSMGKHTKRMNGAHGACSACRRRKVKCDDFEWPCGNCLRSNDRDLCSHPKSSENLTEVLTRRLRRLEKEKEQLCRSKVQIKQEATQMLTKTQEENTALQHQIEELKVSCYAVQPCMVCPEDELRNAAEASSTFYGPGCRRTELLSNPSPNQILHLPVADSLSRQAKHLPNENINIDFDKHGESNGFWTTLGQWQDRHVDNVEETGPRNGRIDEQQGRFAHPFPTAYQSLSANIPCFDNMAASTGIDSTHPHPESTFVADAWDKCRQIGSYSRYQSIIP